METNTSSLATAIKIAGNQSELAIKIGVTQQTISNWLKGDKGKISGDAAVAIERETGVSRVELRPDLFGQVGAAE